MLQVPKTTDIDKHPPLDAETPVAESPAAAPVLRVMPITAVEPSTLNPRKSFDEAALGALADSIRAHGVQQPIVVRPVVLKLGFFQIVMGERRYRAAKVAGLSHIPCLVRMDIDDLAHATLALEENLRRRDLNPIEEAAGYKQCMALGAKQGAIGQSAGVSQSRISNLVRLLELPEDVQRLIADGQLTAGHGIALCRWKAFPEAVSKIAAVAAREEYAVRSLEKPPPALFSQFRDSGLVRQFGYETAFGWRNVCKKCPFGAYVDLDNYSFGFCLRPEHYDELQAEATAAKTAKAKATLAEERAKLAARQAELEAQAKAAVRPTEKDRKAAAKDIEAANKANELLAKGLPHLASMTYGTFARIEATDKVEGCSADCPCRSKAEDYGGRIVDVCLSPGRLNALKAARSKAEKAERKTTFDAELATALKMLDSPAASDAGQAMSNARRVMAILAGEALRAANKATREQIVAHCAAADPLGPEATGLLLGEPWHINEPAGWGVLADLPLRVLTSIAVQAKVRTEIHNGLENGSTRLPLTAWFNAAQPAQHVDLVDTFRRRVETPAENRHVEPEPRPLTGPLRTGDLVELVHPRDGKTVRGDITNIRPDGRAWVRVGDLDRFHVDPEQLTRVGRLGA